MKKIILFILVFSSTLSFAQITLYHNVYVNSEDQSKFEMVERDYMSKLAQKAVNDGKFIYWALEKVLQPNLFIGHLKRFYNPLTQWEEKLIIS